MFKKISVVLFMIGAITLTGCPPVEQSADGDATQNSTQNQTAMNDNQPDAQPGSNDSAAENTADGNGSSSPPDHPAAEKLITETVAIEKAKKEAANVSYDTADHDVRVSREDGLWRVSFVRQDKNRLGGGLVVLMNDNGKVDSVLRGQ